MSRNEERIVTNNDKIPEKTDTVNTTVSSKLNYPTPSEMVLLPSRGKFYPSNHILHGVTEIEIYEMNAHQENILANKAFIKKGNVIEKFLQSLIVDKKIVVDDLLIGDKNALLIAARMTGLGDIYKVNILCPVCYNNSVFDFNLNEVKHQCGSEENYDEEKGLFRYTLPKTGFVVECKALTGEDVYRMSEQAKNLKSKIKKEETPVSDLLKQIIVSVNTVTDRLDISRFVEKMPSIDSRFLREEYRKSVPEVDLTQPFECPSCGQESEVEVPIGPNFLWSK